MPKNGKNTRGINRPVKFSSPWFDTRRFHKIIGFAKMLETTLSAELPNVAKLCIPVQFGSVDLITKKKATMNQPMPRINQNKPIFALGITKKVFKEKCVSASKR